jgi:chromosome segregation ATPase
MSARIAELEASAQAAITERALLAENLATTQSELNNISAQLSAAKNDLADAEKAIAEIKAEADAAAAKHAEEVAAAEASAAAKAAEIAANAGFEKPLEIDGGESGKPKTITRAELSKMKPFEVSAFFKSGGKLSD